jgi:hypothetical protein
MDPSIFDPSNYGLTGTDSYGFTVGPQSDGTTITPLLGQTISNGADQSGNGASYDPAVLGLLNNGLSAFTSIYKNGQTLDYQRYAATQAGLVAQGQAQSSLAAAQITAVNSNKMVLILGVLAVIALAVHKG